MTNELFPVSFTCDYNEGAHPDILRRLLETNLQQEPGYGCDRFTQSAITKIRQAIACPNADVVFMVGGTQTNATVIDGLLPRYGAVIAVSTGHIAVHEAGAIEHTGHKVIPLTHHDGKMHADELRNYLVRFFADDTWQHMANPKMVYLSFPTEYGTIYSRRELEEIHAVCQEYGLLLFVDGARLGYGLSSPEADIDLPTLAHLCDVFYIGGTKVGALCGEAVVFPKGNAPQPLLTIVKQHGALLAKGRLLGIQFDTLFTDNLYFRISRHAIDMAMKLQQLFLDKQIPLFIQSPTNQQFPILTDDQRKRLDGKVLYEVWEKLADGRTVTRFATSWATPIEHIRLLAEVL
jgi:threonine aldolase